MSRTCRSRRTGGWVLLGLVLLLAACRKPDRGRPDTGGPLVVVAPRDAGAGTAPVVPAADGEDYCLEEWRVSIPDAARLVDLAWADSGALLLLERDGTWLLARVGGGGQATAAVLQDYVPEFVAGRAPWGLLAAGSARALALWGWVAPHETVELFSRAARLDGSLLPPEDSDNARRRYFAPAPRPDWAPPGDPTASESRAWLVPFGENFLALVDLWQRDELRGGQLRTVKKHTFAVFNSSGRRASGWDLRASRGAPPGLVGDFAVLALGSGEKAFEVIDGRARRQSGPLAEALKPLRDRVPVAAGCDPAAGCFTLLAAPDAPAGAIPALERLAPDGTRSPWLAPAELQSGSRVETVAAGWLWGRRTDGTVWAAGPDGVVTRRTLLPADALLRRYSSQSLLAALPGPAGEPRFVMACIPGGSAADPAPVVALDGTLDAARAGAAGVWNDRALAALDEIEKAQGTTPVPPPETLEELGTYEAVRRMAARARVLDPTLYVAALTAARLELLAGDPAAARAAFAALATLEPARRERLYLLACRDPRLRVLRWDAEIGAAVGCPEAPEPWLAWPLPLAGAVAGPPIAADAGFTPDLPPLMPEVPAPPDADAGAPDEDVVP